MPPKLADFYVSCANHPLEHGWGLQLLLAGLGATSCLLHAASWSIHPIVVKEGTGRMLSPRPPNKSMRRGEGTTHGFVQKRVDLASLQRPYSQSHLSVLRIVGKSDRTSLLLGASSFCQWSRFMPARQVGNFGSSCAHLADLLHFQYY
ncbi:uncharacterized protein SPSK_02817 [Sporothrix schenckii 1099-18]|uniref:Uncharacterized protein n=1 Tax=Sporothrix schenckii 1099-18 TaxID=1397361 RepID=A0A0F2M9P1_SPOSC|nr:uncharacterized protein SPSK_02817 [Sporothrix schenckii 1099-18]KJR86428.1 hypothetical protein SPSK_02817 [Sporothrix schenckii 1099-18]